MIKDISAATGPDAHCAKAAESMGLPGDLYLAFIATPTSPAIARFNTAGPPWKRVDNVFVTQKPNDLAEGKLLAPIDVRVDNTYANVSVWTGATSPSAAGTDASTCKNWTDPGSSSAAAIVGDNPTSAAMDWFDYTTNPCASSTTHLLCLEK